MYIPKGEALPVCPASDFCTNVGCNGNILALPIGNSCLKLVVECEDNAPPFERTSDVVDGYIAVDLAADYKSGDEVARLLVMIDAPVCCGDEPLEINSPNVLFNSRRVI